jgi:flagellar basal body rod protein FlgC
MKENFGSFNSSDVRPLNIHEGDPLQTNEQRMETVRAEIAALESTPIDAKADPFKATSVDAQIHLRKHELARLIKETSEVESADES